MALAEVLPGFSVDTWWGLVAPAATPKDTLAKLNQAFVGALRSNEVRERWAGMMAEAVPTDGDAFGRLMASELAKYEPVVKASGAKVD